MLTLLCAAKPHWWHGGQPAQAATYRVNVRIKGAHVRRMRSQKQKRGLTARRPPDAPHASPATTGARPRRVPPLVAYGDRTIGAEKSPFQQHGVSYDPHQRRQQETKKKTPADIRREFDKQKSRTNRSDLLVGDTGIEPVTSSV